MSIGSETVSSAGDGVEKYMPLRRVLYCLYWNWGVVGVCGGEEGPAC